MNGTEQRAHRTVTEQLGARVEVLETVVAGLSDALGVVARAADTRIGEERTHRLTLAEEQRAYVDGEDRRVERRVQALEPAIKGHEARICRLQDVLCDRTVWQRLAWLIWGC